MGHSLIDKKTQEVRFGYWPFQDRVKTTLTLISLENGSFDIHYLGQFNKLKIGKVENITIPEHGNVTKRINDYPEIKFEICKYNVANNYAAMQVKIDAEVPGLGCQTIYDQTLLDHKIAS
ncbi:MULTISPECIES: hypothetical protein [Aquimarina]|uniref:Uncharacterized protein n=1 Tax=Aquimarina algiphila TaxID=2047982 RepID=A0A554VAW3_9FLAO|nr:MULTISPECIES: hypothetical protein [Aquimarina]TSE03456.1 hypothetical protein FOF46_29245 [Aquimarina algiphila]